MTDRTAGISGSSSKKKRRRNTGSGRSRSRVSDHPGKRSNNDGVFTLSFIIDRNRCGHGYDRIDREWEVIDTEDLLTDTYEYVRDIVEWELENIEVN